MRRLFGSYALLLGVALCITTAATAQEPPGRVVNPNAIRSVRKPTPAAPVRPAPPQAQPEEIPEDPAATMQAIEESTEPSEPTESTEAETGTVTRTYEQMQVTEEEKRRAAAAAQAAAAEEQQIMGRVRGLQALMEKEEQLLVQRMEYSAKLREKGLTANDQKLLDQAEKYERAALMEYQKKARQFETLSVTPAASSEKPRRQPAPQQRSSSSSNGRPQPQSRR